MARFGFTIKGVALPKLIHEFQKLAFETQAKVIDGVLDKGSRLVLAAAKSLAPADTGALYLHLKIKGKSAFARGGGLRENSRFKRSIVTGTRREMMIDPNVKGYYPFSIEYGYRRANGVHVPARPYMRPALEQNKELIRGNMAREIKRAVEKSIR